MSWLFAKGPKTISELTPFSSQFPNILYVVVKLKHVNSKTVLGPFANNLLKFYCIFSAKTQLFELIGNENDNGF
jgi:hypothetical protein